MVISLNNPIGLLPGVLEESQYALFYAGDVLATFYHPLWSFSVEGGAPEVPANDTVNQNIPPIAVVRSILEFILSHLRLPRKRGYFFFYYKHMKL